MPVVSVGILLSPLITVFSCVTLISLAKGFVLCRRACVSIGTMPGDPLCLGGSGGAQRPFTPSPGDVQCFLHTLCLGHLTEIVHPC